MVRSMLGQTIPCILLSGCTLSCHTFTRTKSPIGWQINVSKRHQNGINRTHNSVRFETKLILFAVSWMQLTVQLECLHIHVAPDIGSCILSLVYDANK